jgi:hypothetical protein
MERTHGVGSAAMMIVMQPEVVSGLIGFGGALVGGAASLGAFGSPCPTRGSWPMKPASRRWGRKQRTRP